MLLYRESDLAGHTENLDPDAAWWGGPVTAQLSQGNDASAARTKDLTDTDSTPTSHCHNEADW